MNLFEKIVEVRKSIDILTKNKKSYSYSYVSGSQILSIIKEKMDELKIILHPEITDITPPNVEEYDTVNSRGDIKHYRDYITQGWLNYVFIDAEKPEDKYVVKWWFIGSQDDPSKSFGSGLTYSERYFLLKFFGAPTDDDDPDNKPEKNAHKTKYKFGYGDSLEWVSDDKVKTMVQYIKDGKKQDVIDSLCKYRWSKKNKEIITKELEK